MSCKQVSFYMAQISFKFKRHAGLGNFLYRKFASTINTFWLETHLRFYIHTTYKVEIWCLSDSPKILSQLLSFFKCFQWQFNGVMYNLYKEPILNLHLKSLMIFSTSSNKWYFFKNSFWYVNNLNLNKNYCILRIKKYLQ